MRLFKPDFSGFIEDDKVHEKAKLQDTMDRCGIMQHKRDIFLFVNMIEYQQNALSSCEMIVVNTAAVRGGNRIVNPMYTLSKSSSVFIELNVYHGMMYFNGGSIDDIKDAHLSFFNVYGTGAITDFHKNHCHMVELSKVSTDDDFPISSFYNPMGQVIVPPIYYTPEHMFSDLGDYHDMRLDADFMNYFIGHEIIDPMTKIHIYDANKWVGVTGSIDNMANKILMDNKINLSDSVSSLFHVAAPSLVNGTTFAYDTVNESYAAQGGNILNSNFLLKDKIKHDMTYLTRTFFGIAKEIEEAYGSVRVFYSPHFQGDQLRIIRRDYGDSIDIKPIYNRNGLIVDINDSSKISRGKIVEDTIQEEIPQKVYQSFDDDFDSAPHSAQGRNDWWDDIPF